MERKFTSPALVFLALCAMPLLAVYYPRSLCFFPLLIGVAGFLWSVFIEKKELPLSYSYFLWVFGIGILWLASSFWSVDPAGSVGKVFQAFPVLLFGFALFDLARGMPLERVKPYLWVFPFCLGLAASVIAIDLYFRLPIYHFTRGIEPDRIVSTAVMNRGIVTVVLSLFAGMFFMSVWDGSRKLKRALSAFLFLSVLSVLILTQSQSAQLAVLVGLIFFLFFPPKIKISYFLVLGIFISLLIAAPWISIFMWNNFALESLDSSWLKQGYAANRMEIWDFISERALQSPLYGHGLEAARLIGDFDHIPIFQKSASILHPHNFALQIWIEFGLLGVCFMSVFMGHILLFIEHNVQGKAARVCMATLMGTLAVAAVGYGMWQTWWLGLLIYLLSLCILVTRFEEISCQKGGQPR